MARKRRFKKFIKKSAQAVGNYARFTADNLSGAIGLDDAITSSDYKGSNAEKWSNASDKVGKRVVQVAAVVLTAGAAGVTLGGVAAVAPKLVKLGSKALNKTKTSSMGNISEKIGGLLQGTKDDNGGINSLLNKGKSVFDGLINNNSGGVSNLSGNGNGNFWDKVKNVGKKFLKDGVEGAREGKGGLGGNDNEDSNKFDFMEFFKMNGQKILMVGVLPLVGLTVLYKSLKR